jgi:hypothetical protein
VRERLTYANIMVTILAFIVLGGSAYATVHLGKNSVGTKQLKNRAVTPAKVSPSAVSLFKGQRGETGPPGASHGFQGSGGTGANSVSASLFGTKVVTVQLPPGNYLVTSTVEADTADGQAGGIQCRLINGDGGPGSSATTRAQDIAASGPAENFTLAGEFAVSAGQSMNLECSRYGASSLVRVDAANIVAVQIADFTGNP